MKLSIIIPVYQVEQYIEECIESLKCQKCEDIEIILVNDGSKDKSIELAEKAIIDDPRFRIVHKTNGGLSDARNYGVRHATGEYVFFLDSDDTIAEGMLEEVISTLNSNDVDMLVFDMLFKWENSDQTKVVPGMIKSENNPVKGLLRATPSACNKIIKREYALEYPFPFGMFYEDLATIPMLYIKANKIKYIDKCYYIYRQRAGSIIYTFNQKTLDVFKCFDRIFHEYKNKGKFEEYRAELEYMAIEHLMLYANRRFINAPNASEYLKKSKNYMNQWFKGWKKNAYFSTLSLNDRLFILVASTGNSSLLKALLKLKHVIKGGA